MLRKTKDENLAMEQMQGCIDGELFLYSLFLLIFQYFLPLLYELFCLFYVNSFLPLLYLLLPGSPL
jgi:hypothetical protein